MKLGLLLLTVGAGAFVLVRPPPTTQLAASRSSTQTQKIITYTSTKAPPPKEKESKNNAAQLLEAAAKLREEALELEKQLEDSALDSTFSIASRGGRVTRGEFGSFLRREVVDKAEASEKTRYEVLVNDEDCVSGVFDDLDSDHDGAIERAEWVSLAEFKERLEQWWTQAHPATPPAHKQQQQQQKTTSQHPAVATRRRIVERTEVFETRANNTGAVARVCAALAYVLPALEMGHFATLVDVPYASHAFSRLAETYQTIPLGGFLALVVLFNVCVEYRVPRLVRFSARHAIILDLLASFVLTPAFGALTAASPGMAPFMAAIPTAFELLVVLCALSALNGTTFIFPVTGSAAMRMTKDCDDDIIDVIKLVAESQTEDDEHDSAFAPEHVKNKKKKNNASAAEKTDDDDETKDDATSS